MVNHHHHEDRRKKKKKQQLQQGIADILLLDDLSEQALLETLSVRYGRDEVYTYVGPILISINPYKWNNAVQQLYSEATMLRYQGQPLGTLSPHLFAIADNAYTNLVASEVESPTNQSIIISGESGAGKTEATKIIMQYLARVTHSQAHRKSSAGSSDELFGALNDLEKRVLDANPLLESFGNAKTTRNDNSSRFGKFIEIQFDNSGRIIGAKILNFLLEKTRIISQGLDERNYHIFYQLLKGADEERRTELALRDMEEFFYLNQSQCYTLEGRDDAHEYKVTRDCMTTIGISPKHQDDSFKVLAAILHLGNVNFELQEDACVPLCGDMTSDPLSTVARLLGVSYEDIKKALCERQLLVGGKTIAQQQRPDQAVDKRDALAKALYYSLFLWLVSELNGTIAAQSSKWGFIGVLDIYGFEKFEWNSFEQLCINYANEKLQRHFNMHIFEVEQAEYHREGIDWAHIDFQDNAECVELIEGKPLGVPGILMALDDVWRLSGEEANKKFLSQLNSSFRVPDARGSAQHKHPNYRQPKLHADREFGIVHYAGEVYYDITGWNDKNNDSLNEDLKKLLQNSSDGWLKDIFEKAYPLKKDDDKEPSSNNAVGGGNTKTPGRRPPSAASGDATRRISRNLREQSVGFQFKAQLSELMQTLTSTKPHYIRCIKPNHEKRPDHFIEAECLRQLRYAGMFETIRIRRQGFALREDHEDFFQNFHILQPNAKTVDELVDYLSKVLRVGKDQWQLGTTKIFLKQDLSGKLDTLVRARVRMACRKIQLWWRAKLRGRAAVKIQAHVKKHCQRSRFRRQRAAATRLSATTKGFLVRKSYRAMLDAHKAKGQYAVKIQAIMRGSLTRKTLRKERHEDLSREDLDELIRAKEAEIETAAAQKQYGVCSELQEQLELLVAARKKKRSFEELERDILEKKKELDVAVRKKDFVRCSELQREVDDLRVKWFSMEENLQALGAKELDLRLRKMQVELADAESRKAFKECELIHARIDRLTIERKKKRTLSDVVADIAKLNTDIAAAAKRKDFKACAALQSDLEELERLQTKLKEKESAEKPATHGELFQQLKAAERELDDAVKSKSFHLCAKLQDNIDGIKKKLEKHPPPATSPVRTSSTISITQPLSIRTSTTSVSSNNAPSPIQAVAPRRPTTIPVTPVRSLSAIEASPVSSSYAPQAGHIPKGIASGSNSLMSGPQASPMVVSTRISTGSVSSSVHSAQTPAAPSLPRVPSVSSTPMKGAGPHLPPTTPVLSTPSKPPAPMPVVKGGRSATNTTPVAGRVRKNSFDSDTGSQSSRYTGVSSVLGSRSTSLIRPESSHSIGSRSGKSGEYRVKDLRPQRAATIVPNMTIEEAAQLMLKKRADAALVVTPEGFLVGILTDSDVTRKVVARSLDPRATFVRSVMTENPKSVSTEDSAIDALSIMLDGRFRHLPVVSPVGTNGELAIAGLLSIAKCLQMATQKLTMAKEHAASLSSGSNSGGIAKFLGPMIDRTFSPSLKTLLETEGMPAIVHVDTSVQSAGRLMGGVSKDGTDMGQKRHKAVLVVDDSNQLVGIFTPKDVLHRVVGASLPPEGIAVGDVMTPDPEHVPPTTTVIEALSVMNDHRILTLPVVTEETGLIHGALDVLSLCYGSFAKGQSHEWKMFWDMALSVGQDDNEDAKSTSTAHRQSTGRLSASSSFRRNTGLSEKKKAAVDSDKTVAQLRPSPAITIDENVTVAEASKIIKAKRGDAALVISPDGVLSGIITDTDMARRVVAQGLDPHTTVISQVMTRSPKCVSTTDDAIDALAIMLDGRFRHLPVVLPDTGVVAGVLNIAKCLQSAIKKLEKAKASAAAATGSMQSSAAVMKLLAPMVERMFSPSLETLLEGEVDPPVVSLGASVREVAVKMGEAKKAALIVDEHQTLVGIFTPKDVLHRVLASSTTSSLSPDEITISDVMTAEPDFVSPQTTVIEAMHHMYDSKILNLPVVAESGSIKGLVDVLSICYGSFAKGKSSEWRNFWNLALDIQDQPGGVDDDAESVRSSFSARSSGGRSRKQQSSGKQTKKSPTPVESDQVATSSKKVADLHPSKVLTLTEGHSVASAAREMKLKRTDAALVVSDAGVLSGIITDNDITRKVIGKGLNPSSTLLGAVMTRNPTCVTTEESAIDALCLMLDGHFRHLPVVDSNGVIVGVLNIARCLYEAIRKLEKATASAASLTTSTGSALNSSVKLLGPMMQRMFAPSLRTVLDHEMEPPMVVLNTSVSEVGRQMGERKKAALIVDYDSDSGDNVGRLSGIFTPKDMLFRVVASSLPAELTSVGEVMTFNPETIAPDASLLDALHLMHEHQILHVPVVSPETGRIWGLLDVLSLCYGSFAKGDSSEWRRFWNLALELSENADDDTESVRSGKSSQSRNSLHSQRSFAGSIGPGFQKQKLGSKAELRDQTLHEESEKRVSELRPSKAVTVSSEISVEEACREMKVKRTDAALVVSPSGALCGIITDTDVARRVVAENLDPATTSLSTVMTANVSCVTMEDNAMEALSVMLEGRFRHLPVVNDGGVVVGMINISKVLYSAIKRMEKATASATALASGKGAAGVSKLLLPMMEKMFSPTLQSLIDVEGCPPLLSPQSTVREAGQLMGTRKKAVLIADDETGKLVGIFTPKDMMHRVIAAGLLPESTTLSEVMTTEPEFVRPDLTVLQAMNFMHDQRILHLPVVQQETDEVVGLLDVLSICYGSFTRGSGTAARGSSNAGTSEWKNFWNLAFDLQDGGGTDSASDAGSASYASSRGSSFRGRKASPQPPVPTEKKANTPVELPQSERTVSQMRPAKALTLLHNVTVTQAAKMLRKKRFGAVLVTSEEGALRGIVTEADVTRRVLAKSINPSSITLGEIMTPNPSCVTLQDSALDALALMLDGRYRHLPVVDETGVVVGMFNIAKCLFDAIERIEKVQSSSDIMTSALENELGASTENMKKLFAPMMEKMLSPTISMALEGETRAPQINAQMTVNAAARQMAEKKKVALVVDDGRLMGILTHKDLLFRVVAEELDPDLVAVQEVMTAEPDTCTPDTTVLEALHLMHDHKYLNIPVVRESGEVYGLADIFALSTGTFSHSVGSNKTDWRTFWNSALQYKEEDVASVEDSDCFSVGTIEEFHNHESLFKKGGSFMGSDELQSFHSNMTATSGYGIFLFKVTDKQGHVHRIRSSENNLSALKEEVAKKLSVLGQELRLTYEDDEGDRVLLSSDDSLSEAVDMARAAGWNRIMLNAEVVSLAPAAEQTSTKTEAITESQGGRASLRSRGQSSAEATRRSQAVDTSMALIPVEEQEDEPASHSGTQANEGQGNNWVLQVRKKKNAIAKDNALLGGVVASAVGVVALGAMFLLRSNRS